MRKTGLDSLEGWFTVLICGLILFLMYGCAGLSSLLYVAAVSRYKTNRNQASFPFIVCNVLQAATGPFVGYFTKKYSERTIVLTGSFIGFVGIGTCFFAETIVEVTVLWGIIFGVGFGFSTLLLPAIINDYFVKHRSTAMGLTFLGSPLGFLIFPPIFEVFLNHYGLSGTYLLLAAINMHCVPLSLFLKKPNFKSDSTKIPLNHFKDLVSYSSMNSPTLDLKVSEAGTIPKKSMRGQINPSLRRFSFEFLWNAPSYFTNSSNKFNKHYVLSLNKANCETMPRRESVRSYENVNINVYKNMSITQCNESSSLNWHYIERKGNSGISKPNTDTNFKDAKICFNHKPDKNHLFDAKENFIETKNSQMNNAEQREKIPEMSNVLNEVTNLSNNKFLRSHAQFSAICYGESSSECKANSSLANTVTNCQESPKSHHHVYSLPEVHNIYHIPSANSTFSPDGDCGVSKTPNVSGTSNESRSKAVSGWTGSCLQGSMFDVYFSPIFILISVANAIFNLQFITLITVIIDFSRDHNIDSSYEKFIMMCISVMGAVGILGFGWVTDGGYLTRNRFASLCMLVGGMCLAILPMTFEFTTFMIVVALWCVVHSCFAPLTPAIIAEYVDEDVQAIAVSAYNVLCAPVYFIIPLLIGYFRDGKGSYDHIFYLLSGLSMLNSIALFIVPCVTKFQK